MGMLIRYIKFIETLFILLFYTVFFIVENREYIYKANLDADRDITLGKPRYHL